MISDKEYPGYINEIPMYITDAYDRLVQINLYGYTAIRAGQPDYTPPKRTPKQEVERWIRERKWYVGRWLSLKANELGYYDERD